MQKLREEAGEKLQENDTFTDLYDDEDEWQENFVNHLREEDCNKILAANLKVGYKNEDLQDKMDYIERLSYTHKKEIMNAIITKMIPNLEKHEQDRMEKFIKKYWVNNYSEGKCF